jgi:hypothetical protein
MQRRPGVSRLARQREEMPEVAFPGRIELTGGDEALVGVLAHGLE